MNGGQNWQGGYGHPQPAQQMPWSGPAGGPPPPPPQQWQPPKKQGKKAGVAIAVVVAIAALAVVGIYLTDLFGDKEKQVDSSYQLVLPVTTGDFRIAGAAEPVTEFDQDRLDKAGISNPKGTTATYYAGISPEEAADLGDVSKLGDREVTTMGVFGLWGTVANPETAVDVLMRYGIEQASKKSGIDMELVGEPEVTHPSGIEGAVMKCQYAEIAGVRLPVCAWADKATVGFVTIQRQNARGPVEVPLHVAVDHTSALRTASILESRVTTEN